MVRDAGYVAVVISLVVIIQSVVTGQAAIVLESKNTSRAKKNNQCNAQNSSISYVSDTNRKRGQLAELHSSHDGDSDGNTSGNCDQGIRHKKHTEALIQATAI